MTYYRSYRLFWLYCIGKVIVGVFFRLFTRLQVEGKENVPAKGGLLVAANHLNFYDPPLLGTFLGRQLTFMAKEELFRFRPVGWFLSSLGAFPVRRGRLDRKVLRRSEKALAEGRALLIFPEATRSPNACLQRALPGSALIASRHSVPVLPVAIYGAERLKGLWLFRRPRITLNIGPTFSLPGAGTKLSREELAGHTELIMRKIAGLLPPQYRGVYGEREK